MASRRKAMDRIRDRTPPRSSFQMLQTQYNTGGRWSRGGTGGGMDGQVHVKVEDLGTVEQGAKVEQEARAEPAEQETRVEQTEQKTTTKEQTEQRTTRAEQ